MKDSIDILLGVAGRLFRERGFRGTSLREIAAAAGMLPGSLHYRFPTKDEILVVLMQRGMRRALAEVRQAIGSEKDPVERVRAAMRTHLDLLLSGDDAIYVLLYEWSSLREKDVERVVNLRDEYDSLWKGMLLELEGAGRLRNVLDLGLVRMLFLGSLNWTAQWFAVDSARSTEQVADAFLAMIGIGIFSEASRPVDAPVFLASHSALDQDIQDLESRSEGEQ